MFTTEDLCTYGPTLSDGMHAQTQVNPSALKYVGTECRIPFACHFRVRLRLHTTDYSVVQTCNQSEAILDDDEPTEK
jgi:hypothetical protein